MKKTLSLKNNMTVLITGARGFIGSNLLKKLTKVNNLTIIEFNRNHTLQSLEKVIGKIDFIYHLAGEVSSKSSTKKFIESNTKITSEIINTIEKSGAVIPILMTSSIHAESQKNVYGISKRKAEIYLEEYSKRHNVPVWIYRLPHVFGEGCKPNHNSVISTWLYNSIYNKEIVVFDRTTPMTYAYVQDVVNEFVFYLDQDYSKCDINNYYKPNIMYNTTLGEVIDYIEEFQKSNENILHYDSDFKSKLYVTYLNYMRNKKP